MAEKVALIGAGAVGRAWAVSFARAGLEVALYDPDPAALEGALAMVRQVLPELERFDLLDGQRPAALRARIRVFPELGAALEGAAHVQESAPEQIAAKRALFAELDRLAPKSAVLASSTTAIRPSLFTEGLAGRARALVAHPINPPYLVPLVEIVPSPWTAPETVAQAADLMARSGQRPVVLAREVDGFVVNRLQATLLAEAFRLVAERVVPPAAVDAVIAEGLALRWAFMGPFETIDLNAPRGVADYMARFGRSFAEIVQGRDGAEPFPRSAIERVIAARRQALAPEGIARRQGWRDRRLMALAAHKRAAQRDIKP